MLTMLVFQIIKKYRLLIINNSRYDSVYSGAILFHQLAIAIIAREVT